MNSNKIVFASKSGPNLIGSCREIHKKREGAKKPAELCVALDPAGFFASFYRVGEEN